MIRQEQRLEVRGSLRDGILQSDKLLTSETGFFQFLDSLV